MHNFIGKTQTFNCTMDPARAAALHATFGLSGTPPSAETPLPPFWHQIYFWDAQPPENLGRDSHPKTGGFIPDLGLPRRMWAGGQLEFHAPLFCGKPAQKITTITKVVKKSGRTGPLAFITLRHDIHQAATHCITEFHDLVYREEPDKNQPRPTPPSARTDEVHCTPHSFDTALLFRYSSLTFNGHRIHYDEAYARDVEGYNGLVVHGPLLAQHLMTLAQQNLGPLKTFTFRATAPLMHTETADFCQNDNALWVRGPDGRQCMTATAT